VGTKALEPVTLNTSQVTPPRPAGEAKKSVLTFDDFDRLLGLLCELAWFFLTWRTTTDVTLDTVSHLLGMLGLVLVKVKLLDATRRLCEWHAGTSYDGQCGIG
jgi:separase